jgi:hypothetical protein
VPEVADAVIQAKNDHLEITCFSSVAQVLALPGYTFSKAPLFRHARARYLSWLSITPSCRVSSVALPRVFICVRPVIHTATIPSTMLALSGKGWIVPELLGTPWDALGPSVTHYCMRFVRPLRRACPRRGRVGCLG